MRLPSGNYCFTARQDPTTIIAPFSIGLTSITAPRTLDWDLTGTEWTGTLRSATTLEPLANGYVSVGSYTYTNSDANGVFRFIVQTGSVYSLTAYAPDMYAMVSGVVAGSDSTLELLLSPLPNYGARLERGRTHAP
jgi:hypothetical protein